jgi:uncharacterized protein (TIGR00369 family)
MSALTDAIEALREGGDLRSVTDAIPYHRFLGFGLVREGDEILGKLTFTQGIIGHPGLPAIHGGAIGALLESTAIFAVIAQHPSAGREGNALPKTITFTVDYLRSARPKDTFAKARIVRRGRRIATVQVEAWQDERDKPIAAAKATFLVEGPSTG